MSRLALLGLAVSMAVATGCSPRVEVEAEIDGPFVSFEVSDAEPGDRIRLDGVEHVAEDRYTTFRVLASEIGAGDHTLKLRVDRGEKTGESEVRVSVPPAALEPMVAIGPCRVPDDARDRERRRPRAFKLTTSVWSHVTDDFVQNEGRDQICSLHDDGAARIGVQANGDAVVTIGGVHVELDAGVGEARLPLSALASQIGIRELEQTAPNKPLEVDIEAVVAVGDKRARETVTVSTTRSSFRDALAEALGQFQPQRPLDWPRREPTGGGVRALVLHTERAIVKVGKEERSVMNGTFAEWHALAGDGARFDAIDLVAVAKPVDVVDEGSCKGYVAMPGAAMPRTRLFKMGFDVTVYDHRGERVASKSFPGPAKGKCPGSVTGKRGETTVIVHTPAKDDVLQWLESVRSGA